MNKSLKYYLDLNYPMEIQKISEEEGGGYKATIPQLGKYAFVGDGDNIEEAIDSLNNIKEYLFKKYIAEGIPFPEPQAEEEKEYSGKFLLRVPKELHRFLVREAKKNETTLNQYCTYILTRKSVLNTIHAELSELSCEIKDVFCRIREINYRMDQAKPITGDERESLWTMNLYSKSA